jgi:hypothetical protein
VIHRLSKLSTNLKIALPGEDPTILSTIIVGIDSHVKESVTLNTSATKWSIHMTHRYTYKPTQEALEKRRAAAMDFFAVLVYAAALTALALAYFDILTF